MARADDHRPDRPLDQDRHGQAQPEQQPCAAGRPAARRGLGRVDARQRRHGQGRRPRTAPRRSWRCSASVESRKVAPSMAPARRPARGAEEGRRAPGAGRGRQHGAQQRRDAVGPDRRGPRRLETGRRAAACSQWMPTGFLKRGSSWKRMIDEVAGLQHLGGGLGEAALVAVERRHGEQAGQAGQEGDQGRQRRAAPAGGCSASRSRVERHVAVDSTILRRRQLFRYGRRDRLQSAMTVADSRHLRRRAGLRRGGRRAGPGARDRRRLRRAGPSR